MTKLKIDGWSKVVVETAGPSQNNQKSVRTQNTVRHIPNLVHERAIDLERLGFEIVKKSCVRNEELDVITVERSGP